MIWIVCDKNAFICISDAGRQAGLADTNRRRRGRQPSRLEGRLCDAKAVPHLPDDPVVRDLDTAHR